LIIKKVYCYIKNLINNKIPFRYIVVFPLLFTILLIFINFSYFNTSYDPAGDPATTFLRIEQAKNLTEQLGPYSRFQFNNIGPIYFYYYALMDNVLFFIKSEVGRINISQLLINALFIIWSIYLIYSQVKIKEEAVVFFIIFILTLLHFSPNLYFSTWGPNQIIFPMLLFVIATTCFASGKEKAIIPSVISAIFMVHQHISSLTIATPFCMIGLTVFFFIKKKEKLSVKKRYFCIGLIILISLNIIPLIEQFTSPEGNLTKIFNFLTNFKHQEHSFVKSLEYIASFFSDPFKISFPFSPLWVLVTFIIIAGILYFKIDPFHRFLFGFTAIGLIISVYATMNIARTQHKYIMRFEIIFAVLLFHIIICGIIKLSRIMEVKHIRKYLGITAIAIIILTAIIRYDIGPRKNTRIASLYNKCKLQKNQKYQIFLKRGTPNHSQWSTAVGFAFKLVREGFEISSPKEWELIFGKSLSASDSINLKRISFRKKSNKLYQNIVRHTRGQIEWGDLLPLVFQIKIKAASEDDYFDNFTKEIGKKRFNMEFPCAVRIPIGDIPANHPGLKLSLILDSIKPLDLEISLNGKNIGKVSLLSHKIFNWIKFLDRSYFLANATNYLNFSVVEPTKISSNTKLFIFHQLLLELTNN